MSRISLGKHFLPTFTPFDLHAFQSNPRNVLVVSPHPDDDVIGLGGTMALLAKRGIDVFSLYVTDGSSPVLKHNRIHLMRQKEALNALRIIEARGGIFLKHQTLFLPDTGNRAMIEEIKAVLEFFMPGTVYVASPFERHKTHVQVSDLTIKAIRQIKSYSPRMWGYHVWGGFYGLPRTRAVDISKVIEVKKKAIRKHKSQIQGKAYDSGMIGRNHYEGVFLETHKSDSMQFAEMFLDMQELVLNKRLSFKTFSKKIMKEFLADFQRKKIKYEIRQF
jgi:LmbE family N-acetylglucosaminyl deacetylase